MTVHLMLTRRFRAWALLLAFVSAVFGWGTRTQPELFDSPLYEPMLDMLPLAVWWLLWCTVSVLMLAAVITRWAKVWLAGSVLAIALASMWLVGISWAHWALGARVSPLGWALWVYLVATQIFVVSAPAFTKYEGRVAT